MNTKHIYHLSVAALLLLTACSGDPAFDGQVPPQPGTAVDDDLVPVMFTVSDKVDFTRAATSIVTFNNNEDIKVFVKPSGAGGYTGYTYTTSLDDPEVPQQTGVSLTAPATPPYFPTGAASTVEAYAYYPASAVSGETFSVAADQTSNANYKASDLMFAANRTITKNVIDANTNLAMDHLMAQLHLNITGSGVTVSSVKVNAKRSVTFAVSAAGVPSTTLTGSASDIVAATAAGEAYVCIPVQPINTVQIKVVVSGSGDEASRTATFTFTSTDNFEAGKSYPINLTVSAAQLGSTTAITDWNGQQSVTIAPSGDMTIDPISARTYTGSAHTFAVTVKKNGETVASSNYDLTWINNIHAGTGVVVATGKGSYAGSVAVGTFIINKANVSLTAPAKNSGLTYSGSAQALVTTGSVTGGTLKYKLDDGAYGTSVPTAINANPTTGYSVTYYVQGDDDHNSTDPVTISGITIAKYTPTWGSWSSNVNSVGEGSTFTRTISLTGANSEALTVTYSSSDNTKATVNGSGLVTGVAEGTATITASYAGNSNYNAPVSQTYTVTVTTGVDPTQLQLGDIIYADGSWSRNNALDNTKTAVGVVVYVASSSGDAACEAGKTCRSGSGTVTGKVLVMSLQDVSGTKAWFTANSTDHDNTLFPNCNNNKSTASSDYRGYEKTKQMATKTGECASHTHAAATEAWNYVPTGATSSSAYLNGSTGWFLPSIGQWFKVFQAMAGAASVSTTVPDAGSWSGSGTVATKLSTYITNAGGNASTLVGNNRYWSSSEYSGTTAQYVTWYTGSSYGFLWNDYTKSYAYCVRPFLAY